MVDLAPRQGTIREKANIENRLRKITTLTRYHASTGGSGFAGMGTSACLFMTPHWRVFVSLPSLLSLHFTKYQTTSTQPSQQGPQPSSASIRSARDFSPRRQGTSDQRSHPRAQEPSQEDQWESHSRLVEGDGDTLLWEAELGERAPDQADKSPISKGKEKVNQLKRLSARVYGEKEGGQAIQRIILDSNLALIDAGLKIRNVVPGFDLCRLTISNLPIGTKRHEITELLLGNGADNGNFCVEYLKPVEDSMEAVVLVKAEDGEAIAHAMEGLVFRDRILGFEASENAGRNAMDELERDTSVMTIVWYGRPRPGHTWQKVQILDDPPKWLQDFLTAQNGGQLLSFEVVSPPGKEPIKAIARFSSPELAKKGLKALIAQRDSLRPRFRPFLPRPTGYAISIPIQQYLAQEKQWEALTNLRTRAEGGSSNEDSPFVTVHKGRTFATINVKGSDKKSVGVLKVRVEGIVAGVKMHPFYWHKSWMGESGTAFLDTIWEQLKVYVCVDNKVPCLRMYGDPSRLQDAQLMIRDELLRRANQETTLVLEPDTLAFFLRKGLGQLKELVGEDKVSLDIPSRRLVVQGGEEAVHHLVRLYKESKAPGSSDDSGGKDADIRAGLCPVCFTEPSNPETLGCGHSYCPGCIQHFLKEAKSFPLTCVADDGKCQHPISISMIRKFTTEQAFNKLVESAFLQHVEESKGELKFCTTADCKQLFRRAIPGSRVRTLQCPSCFKQICGLCDEEAHEGMSCKEWKRQKELNSTEFFEATAAANGLRKCPSCKKWLQKGEGCNHITCTCGAHICWRCGKQFADGNAVYDHLGRDHNNGIHGDVPLAMQAGVDQEVLMTVVEPGQRLVDLIAEQRRLLERATGRRVVNERELDDAGFFDFEWTDIGDRDFGMGGAGGRHGQGQGDGCVVM